MKKMNEIISYLDEILPNAKCELDHKTDYELLIAVMLSAQTTDKRVNVVTKILFNKYPSLEALRDAKLEDLITIVKSLGSFNKKAKNIKEIADRLLKESKGIVPNDRVFLESLSGVGRKTTNVVLSNLYDEPCIAVDTHVARVSVRLGLANKKDNVLTIERKLNKKIPASYLIKMHHQLVLFGRYYCKAKRPECGTCKLVNMCKEKKKTL